MSFKIIVARELLHVCDFAENFGGVSCQASEKNGANKSTCKPDHVLLGFEFPNSKMLTGTWLPP